MNLNKYSKKNFVMVMKMNLKRELKSKKFFKNRRIKYKLITNLIYYFQIDFKF